MNFFYNVQENQRDRKKHIIYRRNLITLIIYFALFIVFAIFFFRYVTLEGGMFKAYSPGYVISLSLWFFINLLLFWDSRKIILASINGKTIQRGKWLSISQPYELWISTDHNNTLPKIRGQITKGLFFNKAIQNKGNDTYNVFYNRPLGSTLFICAWAIGMIIGVTDNMESTFGLPIFFLAWLVGFGVGIRGFIESFPILSAKFTGKEIMILGSNPVFHIPFQKIQVWIKQDKK